jgi:hypothetical protein
MKIYLKIKIILNRKLFFKKCCQKSNKLIHRLNSLCAGLDCVHQVVTSFNFTEYLKPNFIGNLFNWSHCCCDLNIFGAASGGPGAHHCLHGLHAFLVLFYFWHFLMMFLMILI